VLALLPATGAFQPYLTGAALALGLVALASMLITRRLKGETGRAPAEPAGNCWGD